MTVPLSDRNSSKERIFPLRGSISIKSCAGVPSGTICEGVKTIFATFVFAPWAKLAKFVGHMKGQTFQRWIFYLALAIALWSTAACHWKAFRQDACTSIKIVDRPIIFDSTRARLTIEYMKSHYGMDVDRPTIQPKMIVVHWTAIPDLERSFAAFDPVFLPSSRSKIRHAGALNVSAHYLIDRDGTIYRLLPDTIMARHVIGLNHAAIGIENVGDASHPLTEDQLRANACLIRQLVQKYPIEYLLGHHEYTRFIGHPLWKELDTSYLTYKVDPGDAFMEALRSKLHDLTFQPLPTPASLPKPTIDETQSTPPSQNAGLAKIVWHSDSVHFGTVQHGEVRHHTYRFTNVGTAPLKIEMVSACDCAEIDYPKHLIAPGESGAIRLTFYSARRKPGHVRVEIDVIANTEPFLHTLILEADVLPQ